jgi:hypothetical protein
MAAAPLYLPAVVLPALAVNANSLFLAALVVNAANGTLDIAINAQGFALERSGQRRLFNSLHAAFSFGALAGTGLAGVVAGLGVAPLPHLAGVALLGYAAAAVLAPHLVRDEGAAAARGPRSSCDMPGRAAAPGLAGNATGPAAPRPRTPATSQSAPVPGCRWRLPPPQLVLTRQQQQVVAAPSLATATAPSVNSSLNASRASSVSWTRLFVAVRRSRRRSESSRIGCRYHTMPAASISPPFSCRSRSRRPSGSRRPSAFPRRRSGSRRRGTASRDASSQPPGASPYWPQVEDGTPLRSPDAVAAGTISPSAATKVPLWPLRIFPIGGRQRWHGRARLVLRVGFRHQSPRVPECKCDDRRLTAIACHRGPRRVHPPPGRTVP